MSIVLPSVADLIEQKANNYIQDGHLRSMDEVDILHVYCRYHDGQFVDDSDVSFDDSIASRGKVF